MPTLHQAAYCIPPLVVTEEGFVPAVTGDPTAVSTPVVWLMVYTEILLDPTGKFAYAANYTSNNVSVYTIDQTSGVLTAVGTAVAAGTGPYSVTTSGGMQ